MGLRSVYELTPSGGGWKETILTPSAHQATVTEQPLSRCDLRQRRRTSTERPMWAALTDGDGVRVDALDRDGRRRYPTISKRKRREETPPPASPSTSPGPATSTAPPATVARVAVVRFRALIHRRQLDIYRALQLYRNRLCGPWGSLVMDGTGNLYGTTMCDGAYGYGSVFRLTPTPTPPWTYTSLHDFTQRQRRVDPA